MKGTDYICFHTHRKVEKTHISSTESPPPEKTIRVKKNDNMIWGHLKRYGLFVQSHKICRTFDQIITAIQSLLNLPLFHAGSCFLDHEAVSQ